jgi:hypothetical protein
MFTAAMSRETKEKALTALIAGNSLLNVMVLKSSASILPEINARTVVRNWKVFLVRLRSQERSELQPAVRTNETQRLQTQCSNICKLNYPAVGGGYQRYPWYPDGVVYRD